MSHRRLKTLGLVGCLFLSSTVSFAEDAPEEEQFKPAAGRELVAPLPKSMPRPLGDPDTEALPIDWPTVLELARASSLEIDLATEKVNEAHRQLTLAKQQWLPSLQVGTSWLHHEGRTQDIPGQIIDTSKSSIFAGGYGRLSLDPQKVAIDVLKAKQQVYSRSGQLDRATREALQETSLAYLNLVAAQAGAAISIEISELIDELVKRAQQFRAQGLTPEVEVLRSQSQSQSQQQSLSKAKQNQLAASARLVQLLNLEPGTRLFAHDDYLTPITLVDVARPEKELIEVALNQGPGLAEVMAMIEALETQQRQLRRISLLPSVSADIGQGAFGGGFGGTYSQFDNRNDVGVHVYWDLMRIVGTSQTRELFESQRRQATLAHDQLIAKLSAGVIVSRHTALAARQRISFAEAEIDTAIRSYQLSKARLDAQEASSPEVLSAIGSLGTARANYLEAVIAYNRAQIELQYLIGFQPGSGMADDDCVSPETTTESSTEQQPQTSTEPTTEANHSETVRQAKRHPKAAYAKAMQVGRVAEPNIEESEAERRSISTRMLRFLNLRR